MTRTFDEWMEKGEKGWATPSGQPAGGPSDLSRFASQPNGAHQAQGRGNDAWTIGEQSAHKPLRKFGSATINVPRMTDD